MTCSSVKIFDCNVFLSKLSSVFLTDEKSFTIMLLLLSLEWKRLISIPEWELSFMMSLNSWCFFGEKQTPQCSVLSFCIKKLKYLLWTPLLETPPKDTQIQIHLNNKLKTKKSNFLKCARHNGLLSNSPLHPSIFNRFEWINSYCPWPLPPSISFYLKANKSLAICWSWLNIWSEIWWQSLNGFVFLHKRANQFISWIVGIGVRSDAMCSFFVN